MIRIKFPAKTVGSFGRNVYGPLSGAANRLFIPAQSETEDSSGYATYRAAVVAAIKARSHLTADHTPSEAHCPAENIVY